MDNSKKNEKIMKIEKMGNWKNENNKVKKRKIEKMFIKLKLKNKELKKWKNKVKKMKIEEMSNFEKQSLTTRNFKND